MKKHEKEKLVEQVKSSYQESSVAVLLKNKGLTVSEFSDIRRKLKASNTEIKVVKNTLSKIAIDGTDYAVFQGYFEGPVVSVWSKGEPVSPAKVITAFLKDQQKAEFVAGAIKGKVFDLSGLNALSTMPSREELLSKMLGSLKSPVTGIVTVLSGVQRSFLNVLISIKEKKNNN